MGNNKATCSRTLNKSSILRNIFRDIGVDTGIYTKMNSTNIKIKKWISKLIHYVREFSSMIGMTFFFIKLVKKKKVSYNSQPSYP